MEKNISIIGAGTIGTAVAIALNKNFHVIATRRNKEKIKDLESIGIKITSNNQEAVNSSDIILFSLKPMDTAEEIKKMSRELEGKIIISLAAALPIQVIKKFSPSSFVVRAMTNIAARVGGGFTVYSFEKDFPEEKKKIVLEILSSFGEIEEVEERYMDALTAVSGSGPAYILTVIEAMMYAGLKVGLPRDLALKASYETVLGAAKLVSESGDHPSILKELIITPSGVTIDAIYELEDSGIRTAFMRAIESATNKSKLITENIIEKLK